MDVTADYLALRRDVGAVELPRDVVYASGPDTETFLQGQLSQDVAALAVGASAPSLLLSPQGKLVVWLRVSRLAPGVMVLDTDAGWGDAIVERLQRFKLRTRCDLERRPSGAASPCAVPRTDELDLAAAGAQVVADAAWGGMAGRDLLGPDVVVPDGRAALRPRRVPQRAHRVRGAGHGSRAGRRHDPRRGRDRRGLGELDEGLLHRPGAGGPHRLAGHQRAPPAARRRPRRQRAASAGRDRPRARRRRRRGRPADQRGRVARPAGPGGAGLRPPRRGATSRRHGALAGRRGPGPCAPPCRSSERWRRGRRTDRRCPPPEAGRPCGCPGPARPPP